MDDYWDRVFAVYKARFTLGLAFLAAFLSLIGYGVANDKFNLLLPSAMIPIIALIIDCVLVWVLAAPVIYIGLTLNSQKEGQESALKLLLAYSERSNRLMKDVMAIESSTQRQRKFRMFLLKRGLITTGPIMVGASLLTALAWWLTH